MGNRTPCHRAATAAKPAMPKAIYGIDSPWCSPLLERCRIKILHYQVQVIQHRFPKTLAFSARRNERSQCVPTAVQVRFHGDPFTGMREIRVNDGDFPSFEQYLLAAPPQLSRKRSGSASATRRVRRSLQRLQEWAPPISSPGGCPEGCVALGMGSKNVEG
jgi:hypothetical protein